MKPSIVAKLEALQERHEEVQAMLGDASVIADQDKFRSLSREYAQLTSVSECFLAWRQAQEDLETAEMMLDDPEMREMAQDEIKDCKATIEDLEQKLQLLLLPKDPDDERGCSLKFVQEPAVMKRRFLPVTYSACTAVMQNRVAGVWKS